MHHFVSLQHTHGTMKPENDYCIYSILNINAMNATFVAPTSTWWGFDKEKEKAGCIKQHPWMN